MIITADNSFKVYDGKTLPALVANSNGIFWAIFRKGNNSFESICIKPYNDHGFIPGSNYTLFSSDEIYYYDGTITFKNN
jgi:hypothetical protein